MGDHVRYQDAIFPFEQPGAVLDADAFLGIWLFSKLDRTKRALLEEKAFEAQFIRSETGIGAATANVH